MRLAKDDYVVFKTQQLKELYPWAENITEAQIDKIISNFSYLHKAYVDIEDLFKEIDGISKNIMMNVPSQMALIAARNEEGNQKALRVFLPKYDISYITEAQDNVPKRLNISKTIIDIVRDRTKFYIQSPEIQAIKNTYMKKYHIRPCRDYEYLHKYAFDKLGFIERNYEMFSKLQMKTEEELQYDIIFNKTGSNKIVNFVNFTIDDVKNVVFEKINAVPIDYDTFKFIKDSKNENLLKAYDEIGKYYQEAVGMENITINAFAHLMNSDKNSIDYYLMNKYWNELEFNNSTLKDILKYTLDSYQENKDNPLFQKTKTKDLFDLKDKKDIDVKTISFIVNLLKTNELIEDKNLLIENLVQCQNVEEYIDKLNFFSNQPTNTCKQLNNIDR